MKRRPFKPAPQSSSVLLSVCRRWASHTANSIGTTLVKTQTAFYVPGTKVESTFKEHHDPRPYVTDTTTRATPKYRRNHRPPPRRKYLTVLHTRRLPSSLLTPELHSAEQVVGFASPTNLSNPTASDLLRVSRFPLRFPSNNFAGCIAECRMNCNIDIERQW